MAFVVPKEGSFLTEAAVMNYVAKQVTILAALIRSNQTHLLIMLLLTQFSTFLMQVAPYKKVRKVYFRSSIQRSPAGKVLRRELKNLLVSKL